MHRFCGGTTRADTTDPKMLVVSPGSEPGSEHWVTEGPAGLAATLLTTRWQVHTKKVQGWTQVSSRQVTGSGGDGGPAGKSGRGEGGDDGGRERPRLSDPGDGGQQKAAPCFRGPPESRSVLQGGKQQPHVTENILSISSRQGSPPSPHCTCAAVFCAARHTEGGNVPTSRDFFKRVKMLNTECNKAATNINAF